MIKIGIDPSGTGTTGIVIYEDNKIIHKQEFFSKDWKDHYELIDEYIDEYYFSLNENGFYVHKEGGSKMIWNIENCLYTNANASKDRDDLLRLLWSCTISYQFLNWVSSKYTKSVLCP
ncbi:hypothetical protein C6B38_05635 [Spiroplasma sp. ChiS]|uniref:hypothetical protein n=1 Tax=Spiroplasma sp. ChiS TaxID=2099885 RepID=UPI000CF90A96|nr:hypothetical protein [Spiroplasma sp. ChiS]PQP78493.1 hypothetical protein C6B38_05635 [Spiroplasma sp. ChiS]